jgi:MerR family transcriptional regulator, light-induced transcriptional regulator
MTTHYPIRAVAKITGLGLDTIRAWERRYKAVVPVRGDRERQYTPENVERLLLLAQVTKRGHSIGRVASMEDVQLRQILEHPRALTPGESTDLLGTVLHAVRSYDALGAADELNRLAAALGPREVVLRVVLPLMAKVGEGCGTGAFRISQEHLLTNILRNLLGSFIRLYRPAGGAAKIVLATLPGEMHDFGLLAGAMFIAMSGLEPVYLGADLPTAEVAEAALKTHCRAVLIAATVPDHNASTHFRDLAEQLPQEPELWLSGAADSQVVTENLGRPLIRLADFQVLEENCRRLRG